DFQNVLVAEPMIHSHARLLTGMAGRRHSSWTAHERFARRSSMGLFRRLAAVLACATLASCAVAAPPAEPIATPTAQPFVLAPNPLAAEAGLNVLKRGGSAVGAAIAVQAMLSLV